MKKLLLLFAVYLFLYSATYGQCTIEITSITQTGPGSPPPAVNIEVKGFVKNGGCSKVEVQLCCSTQVAHICRTQIVDVNPDNTWSTLFKNFACPCAFNSFIVIAKASCSTNPACTPAQKQLTIKCPSGNCCPQILNVTHSFGNCITDNSGCKKREVTFTPVTTCTGDVYTWNFGDNSPVEQGNGNPVAITHLYSRHPGAYPVLTVIKLGCNPASVSYMIMDLGDFTLCDDCPPAGSINLSQLTTDNCVLAGKISASFCQDEYLNFMVDYGDNSQSQTMNIALLNGLQINHSYTPGSNYTFKITLLRDGANCSYTKTFSCDCKDCPSGGSCGWKFWKCLCGILAFFVGLWVMTRVILMALGWSFSLPIGTFSWAAILDVLGLGLALWIAIKCPCDTAWMIVAGASAGIATIIGMIIAGVSVPKWLEAIVVGLSLILVMSLFIYQNGC
jgi:hypothetical protein